MAGKIFISYRRSDTAWAARALFERLWREFPDRVFIDLEGLRYGRNFEKEIDKLLDDCEVMLAVIGAGWLPELKKRRDDKRDWVRLELARTLSRDIPVIPVRMDDADDKFVLHEDDLPEELKELSSRHGLSLESRHFDAQMKHLVGEVRGLLSSLPESVGAEMANRQTAAPPAPGVAPLSSKLREAWMHDHGKDTHGHWADLRINNVTQRLRWIEPGEFWMGSTEAERKRFAADLEDDKKAQFDKEAPRHRVHLTQGFWLADTACTQALWQTVVGENPSHFTGDLQLPVEQVSGYDISQKFLPALNGRLQGAEAALPTEAQWEYACRAGTETAYSFGELITPEQVNYNGNFPSTGGERGVYRECTAAVTALPMNAWGLYQMHGNVWEWCADGPRTYEAKAEKDPIGTQDSGFCALRGGAWDDDGAGVRSAFRAMPPRSYAFQSGGFRFLLRSHQSAGGAR